MSILYLLSVVLLVLLLALLAVAWGVTASCAIAWYEYANRDPRLIACRHLPERQWLASRLIVREIGAVCLTLLAHPFGFLPERAPRLQTPARPVILLHGLFHNRAVWFLLRRRLERQGHAVVTVNLPPWHDIDRQARHLGAAIEETLLLCDTNQIDLVGHSMGGLLARYYIQQYDREQQVGRCVLLGAPNAGSKLAPFAISAIGRQLIPGSDFLAELNVAPLSKRVPVTSIYSNHDNLVIPSESACLPDADNVDLEWVGHATLLFDEDAANAVLAALKRT